MLGDAKDQHSIDQQSTTMAWQRKALVERSIALNSSETQRQ